MEINNINEKIIKALDAVKAASEYCLFNAYDYELICMTKAEWASWTQAIFSIIAIFIAVAIPVWLSVRDSMEKKVREIDYAWVTGMEIFGLTRAMLNRLDDLIQHYEDVSDRNLRVGQMKVIHQAFSAAGQPSEEQLLRLVSTNKRFVAYLISGFSKIRRVYLNLQYLIAHEHQIDIEMGDETMRHVMLELKDARTALKFGIDELIDFLNSKTANSVGFDGGVLPHVVKQDVSRA